MTNAVNEQVNVRDQEMQQDEKLSKQRIVWER